MTQQPPLTQGTLDAYAHQLTQLDHHTQEGSPAASNALDALLYLLRDEWRLECYIDQGGAWCVSRGGVAPVPEEEEGD